MVRIFAKMMFIIVPILMVAGMFWNYQMYRDCRADGHKSYECQAMLSQNSRAVVLDDISNN